MTKGNVTVSSDEETHRLARFRAAELGTSVSALAGDYLRNQASGSVYVERNTERRSKLMRKVIQDSDARVVGCRMYGILTREELYDQDRSRVEE